MLRRVVAAVVGEIVLILLLYAVIVDYPWGDSTMYGGTYSESGFNRIREGNTKAQVQKLVGPPLTGNAVRVRIEATPTAQLIMGPDAWSFTMPGRQAGSTAHHVRGVLFDNQGKVARKVAYYEWD